MKVTISSTCVWRRKYLHGACELRECKSGLAPNFSINRVHAIATCAKRFSAMSVAARLPPGRSSIPRLHQAALSSSGVSACARRKTGIGPAAGTPASGMDKPGKGPPPAQAAAKPPHAARSKEGAGLLSPGTRAMTPYRAKVTSFRFTIFIAFKCSCVSKHFCNK